MPAACALSKASPKAREFGRAHDDGVHLLAYGVLDCCNLSLGIRIRCGDVDESDAEFLGPSLGSTRQGQPKLVRRRKTGKGDGVGLIRFDGSGSRRGASLWLQILVDIRCIDDRAADGDELRHFFALDDLQGQVNALGAHADRVLADGSRHLAGFDRLQRHRQRIEAHQYDLVSQPLLLDHRKRGYRTGIPCTEHRTDVRIGCQLVLCDLRCLFFQPVGVLDDYVVARGLGSRLHAILARIARLMARSAADDQQFLAVWPGFLYQILAGHLGRGFVVRLDQGLHPRMVDACVHRDDRNACGLCLVEGIAEGARVRCAHDDGTHALRDRVLHGCHLRLRIGVRRCHVYEVHA